MIINTQPLLSLSQIHSQRIEYAQAQLALSLAQQIKDDFFSQLCHQLVKLFSAQSAFVLLVDSRPGDNFRIVGSFEDLQSGQNGNSFSSFRRDELPFQISSHPAPFSIIRDVDKLYPNYIKRFKTIPQTVAVSTFFDDEYQAIGFLLCHFPANPPTLSELSPVLQPFVGRISAELKRYYDELVLRLAAVAFETNDCLVVTDAKRRVQRVNQAFCQMIGYRSDELIDKPIEQLFPGIEDELFSQLNDKEFAQGEYLRRHKDGLLYPHWETLKPVIDEQGVITYYLIRCTDLSSQRRTEQKIYNLAYHDELTGLANRRKLLIELKKSHQNAALLGQLGALMFIDLDRFKNINDSLGHEAGDWILQQVAGRLKDIVRQGDLLARLGGDEFVLLFPYLGDSIEQVQSQAKFIGQRLIADISRPYLRGTQKLHLGASVGVSVFPLVSQTPEDLLRQADTAMYRAKSEARQSIIFYEQSMQQQADRRLRIHNAIKDGLTRQEFELYYQPQHMLETNELMGAEALLRWTPQGQRMMMPDEFIPIAEESELIVELGRWVLQESCRTLVQWLDQGLRLPELSLNVSAKQFHDPEFISFMLQTLQETGLDPAYLNFEITESVVLNDFEDTIRIMTELKSLGISFSIDDFGAGYSSLSYLKRLPIDELKIDRSFVSDIPRDRSDMAIIEAVLDLAQHLGFTVTAEGVETPQQKEFLRRRGCQFYQGFLVSKPLPKDVMTRYIQKQVG
ncbi:EAL domain-containing protein [Celerinatantimonas sp. YJH-8]|uniref:EAL domain-containing protein n=1 Tax=Celerinatantimonas sp. YJH-8 TaxID=3228714 RepID=UPI0038C847A4